MAIVIIAIALAITFAIGILGQTIFAVKKSGLSLAGSHFEDSHASRTAHTAHELSHNVYVTEQFDNTF